MRVRTTSRAAEIETDRIKEMRGKAYVGSGVYSGATGGGEVDSPRSAERDAGNLRARHSRRKDPGSRRLRGDRGAGIECKPEQALYPQQGAEKVQGKPGRRPE